MKAKAGTIHDSATLIGHKETVTYLVHRDENYGDHWVVVDDRDEIEEQAIGDFMRERLAENGGVLLKVQAEAVVVSAEVVDDADDE